MPMTPGLKFGKSMEVSKKNEKYYRRVIGSLQYLASGTRPNICFAVNLLARFVGCQGEEHIEALDRLLKYITFTHTTGLELAKNHEEKLKLGLYSDADLGGGEKPDIDDCAIKDCRSTTGYAIKLSGSRIIFKSRKQKTTAKSSTEAKILAASECFTDYLFVVRLLHQIFRKEYSVDTVFNCDNEKVIRTFWQGFLNNKTRHVEIRLAVILEAIVQNKIQLSHIAGINNPADLLTKALPAYRIRHLQVVLGVSNPEVLETGGDW
jgi:hypothetical protein